MQSSEFSTITPLHHKGTDFDICTWSVPFGGLQANYIIWKYKQLFPGEILADRIKLWPTGLAKAVHKKYNLIDMEEVKAAAEQHEKERQNILNQMRKLIIRKNCLLTMSPLQKLELYENMKYMEFQHGIRTNYRIMRKYFPWLLSKRKYKPKKKSAAKIKRRYEKKQLAKKTQNGQSVSATTTALDINIMPTPTPWWKKWDPVKQKYVTAPTTYANSGFKAKNYPANKK